MAASGTGLPFAMSANCRWPPGFRTRQISDSMRFLSVRQRSVAVNGSLTARQQRFLIRQTDLGVQEFGRLFFCTQSFHVMAATDCKVA